MAIRDNIPINPRTRRPYRVMPNHTYAAYRWLTEWALDPAHPDEDYPFRDPAVIERITYTFERNREYYENMPTYTVDLYSQPPGRPRFYTGDEVIAALRELRDSHASTGVAHHLSDAEILMHLDDADALEGTERWDHFIRIVAREKYCNRAKAWAKVQRRVKERLLWE